MYEYICPVCGAHLDPGERCDCTDRIDEKKRRAKERNRELELMLVKEADGQLRMVV